MITSLKYDELSSVIKKSVGQDIEFEYVSNDTVKVIKPIQIPLLGTRKIGVDVKVIGFDYLTLKVKTTSDILPKLLGMIPDLEISKYVVIEKDVVNILLGNIEKLRDVFSKVQPTAVSFDSNNINIESVLL